MSDHTCQEWSSGVCYHRLEVGPGQGLTMPQGLQGDREAPMVGNRSLEAVRLCAQGVILKK